MRWMLLRVTLLALASIGFSTCCSATCQAEDPSPATDIRVANLVKRLGSQSYRDRDEASKELASLGRAGRRELEAAAQSPDPEMRLRAIELLQGIKAAELWLPSLVRCRSQGELASQSLADIGRQSGNRIFAGDPYGTFDDRLLNLDYEAGAYWQVIDDLCRQTGNRVRLHYDNREPGIVLVAGAPGKYPTAYAGPLRAQITGAQRSFTEKFDYAEGAGQLSHTFEMEVTMVWEDRFQVVAYRAQPRVVRAVTDTGVVLTCTQPGGTIWNVAMPSSRQLSAKLHLSPPPMAAKQLDRLELNWGLTAAGDSATLVIENLAGQGTHRQDDVEVTVDSIEPRDGNRFEITLVVARELAQPDPHDSLFQEYRVEVIDGSGKLLRVQGHANSMVDRGAQMRFTVAADGEGRPPKSLRFSYPRIRSQRDVEIVFLNVPLPTGRPN